MNIHFGEKKHILFDGAMGTMLQRNGLAVGEKPESFNILHPEIIRKIHMEYVEAGSDIITTNTFGANEIRLSGSGYSALDIVESAVKIAKDTCKDKLVALDIGPTGDFIEPLGNLSFESACDIFSRVIEPGVKSGADLILIETFSDIEEARAAVMAAKKICSLPVFCTFTFQKEGRTFMGYDIKKVTQSLEDMGVDALGINCSVGPEDALIMVKDMQQYTNLPLIVQPNAGLPRMENGNIFYDVTPQEFAHYMRLMTDIGVTFLGGCCGTDPDFIRAISKQL